MRCLTVTASSPLLERGQTWSFTFKVAGTYRYYCSVHPGMRATIVVRPKPQAPSPKPSPAPPPTPSADATPAPTMAAPVPPEPDRRHLIITLAVTVLASLFSLLLLAGTR